MAISPLAIATDGLLCSGGGVITQPDLINTPEALCNLALSYFKIDDPIESVSSPTDLTEEDFALWYDIVRRESLREASWGFARKRAQLNKATEQPAFGNTTAYNLPGDYIRIIGIYSFMERETQFLSSRFYTIEGDTIVITHLQKETHPEFLNLVYIQDYTDVETMSPNFILYFAAALADRLSYKLTQSNATVQRLSERMRSDRLKALSAESQENAPQTNDKRNPRRWE